MNTCEDMHVLGVNGPELVVGASLGSRSGVSASSSWLPARQQRSRSALLRKFLKFLRPIPEWSTIAWSGSFGSGNGLLPLTDLISSRRQAG